MRPMFFRKTLLAAALVAAPLSAFAADTSHLDLYYVGITDLELGAADFEDGDGYGAKGKFALGQHFFLTGEYENNEYDPYEASGLFAPTFEIELETWRAGLGFNIGETPFYVRGEYIGLQSELTSTGSEASEDALGGDFNEDGWGAHVGAHVPIGDVITINAEGGYVDIGDAGDGFEWLVGAGIKFTPNFGAFADYRTTDLDGNNSIDAKLQEARVGLRLSF